MNLHVKKNLSLCLPALLALAVLLAWPGHGAASTAATHFNKGHAEFHSLIKDPKRVKFRANWETVERHFSNCLRADPDGPNAPKALYYIGRVHEELGVQSGRQSDFRKAIDYFGRVVARYPRHGWADDCLYRRAEIQARRLGETEAARLDLARILVEYPRADMYSKADAALRRLGGYDAAVAKVSGKAVKQSLAEVAKRVAESPKPAPQETVTDESGDQRVVPRDPSGLAHLDMVRYRSSDEYTRVVLEMDSRVTYRYQVLEPNDEVGRPHRLYVDLVNSRLGHDVTASTTVSDGILRSIRTGQYNKDTTRVVLDFLSMQEYKVFPLDNPFRIVIDVYSPDQEVAEAQAEARATRAAQKAEQAETPSKKITYRAPGGGKQTVGDLLEQLGLTVKTIMIDPGHGGKDPGAVANGLREKDINLRFSTILGKMLAEKGFNVHYTRTTDVFIPLEQRTAMANVKKADLFLSIHCNANRNTRVSGLETYSLNLAKTNDAVRIAARENAVDPRAISDLQFILTDLMVNSKIKESRDLAADVQNNTLAHVRRKWQIQNNGVREAPFYVLMGAKMPSVLVELGYITNPAEAKRLNTDAYLEYLARGVVDGVLAYKGKIERYAER
ncbi:N-acetylmuramoyl-L-alanine amidase [Pseudodesulfovibrio pelocollis]|uniref:N-acetylmuramoyl-L-alanine amidase n=1 Tax=Pseudodesulfovibrio pelocollis TaxID=3051432 RepID=UPI00255AB1B8|nr:N-acetylmuramoyl-L-alanine amidase [Pseudodesulfovibrio sp. SB368]